MDSSIKYCMGIALFANSLVAVADHPTVAFGIGGAGPINTISANPAPAGSWGFGLQSELIDNNEFTTEQLESFVTSGAEGVHSLDSILNTSLSVSYGVTNDMSISVRLPYSKRKNIREGEIENGVAETHMHGDSSGLGDTLLLGQYRLIKSGDTNISTNFGVKLPMGNTDVKDKDDVRFESEFQPGTGSWDFLAGIAVSKNTGKIAYHANMLYNKTTEGSESTKVGDSFSYNAAITYSLTKIEEAPHDHGAHSHDEQEHVDKPDAGLQVDLMLELNGITLDKNQIGGKSEGNSGGTTVLLSPGIRASIKGISAFVSFGYPVLEKQNGEQADLSKRIITGVSYGF